MPFNDPGSLSEKESLDVLAYVLLENGFPASADKPIATADSLGKIGFIRPK